MTWDDLRDKPRFAEVAERVLAFCDGAEVLIHNAAFDLSFLEAELARVGHGRFRERCGVVLDTLLMARELHLPSAELRSLFYAVHADAAGSPA
jgi:DNA polymerase-3 subunit epsilon